MVCVLNRPVGAELGVQLSGAVRRRPARARLRRGGARSAARRSRTRGSWSIANGGASTSARRTTSACTAASSSRTATGTFSLARRWRSSPARCREDDWGDLLFAWRVCKHVSSNAIVLAKDLQTLGIGAGQTSRIDSVRIAVEKARTHGHDLAGSVLASDALLPLRGRPGGRARRRASRRSSSPGGSKRDQEVIDTVEQAGATMVFTAPPRTFRALERCACLESPPCPFRTCCATSATSQLSAYLVIGIVGGLSLSHWEDATGRDQALWIAFMVGGAILLVVGLRLFPRSNWGGALLVSVGAFFGALPIFWTGLALVLAVVIVLLAVRHARGPSRAARRAEHVGSKYAFRRMAARVPDRSRSRRPDAARAASAHRSRGRGDGRREARVHEPRRLGQGPDRDQDDRGGRARGEAEAGRNDRRADLGQHRRRPRDRRRDQGLPLHLRHARQDEPGEDLAPARVRRRGRDLPLRGRAGVARELLLGLRPAGRGDPRRVQARPVHEHRQPGRALRDDRPRDLGADGRRDRRARDRRRHRRDDLRHRPAT